MARKMPFPFRDHHQAEQHSAKVNHAIEVFIEDFEDALLTEYKSGDADVSCYHEGRCDAFGEALCLLLGIPVHDWHVWRLGAERAAALAASQAAEASAPANA